MTCTPSFAPSSASASPTRKFSPSDSSTHGPAIRNGVAPPAKCRTISVASGGEPGRPLGLGRSRPGPGAMLLARRPHEAGEQRVRPCRPGLELRMELTSDEPRVIGELDDLDQRAVG